MLLPAALLLIVVVSLSVLTGGCSSVVVVVSVLEESSLLLRVRIVDVEVAVVVAPTDVTALMVLLTESALLEVKLELSFK